MTEVPSIDADTELQKPLAFNFQIFSSILPVSSLNFTAFHTYTIFLPNSMNLLFYITASDPACDSNKTSNSLVFWCQLYFQGNWAPVMEWRLENNSRLETKLNVENKTVPNYHLIYTVTIPMAESLDEERLTCTTTFNASMRSWMVRAINVPDYFHVWSSH